MFVLRENSPTNSRRMPLRQPVPQQGEGRGGEGRGREKEGRGKGREGAGKGLAVFHPSSCTTKN